jgi:hypothetical protein
MTAMRGRASKRLVIDASVAKSAGGLGASHRVSISCRDFLMAVLEICHHVVMTPQLATEWRKHASRYSRRWRAAMVARKKVDKPVVSSNTGLLNKTCDALAQTQRPIVTKDWLLVEAALAADRIIVSSDAEARGCLEQAATAVGEIRDIVWVDPTEEVDSRLWLQNGAQAEDCRKIGRLRT